MKDMNFRVIETRKIIHYPRSVNGAFGTLLRVIDKAEAEGFKLTNTACGEYLLQKDSNKSIIIKIEKEQESKWNSQ